jgi:hypothetical protein
VVVWGRRRRVVVVVRRVAVDEVVARRSARWARARENIVVDLYGWRVLSLSDVSASKSCEIDGLNLNLKDDLG